MTYEEKLEVFKRDGQIPTSWIEPPDYFRFMRDNALHIVHYTNNDGKKIVYEVQCTSINEDTVEEAYDVNECHSKDDFNAFIRDICRAPEGTDFYLEEKYYHVCFDILETE